VTIGREAFEECTKLTEVIIPDNVNYIYYEAFNGCSNLNKVSIGSGVLEIGQAAFGGCKSLSELYVKAASAPDLGYNPISVTSLASIFVPSASLADYKSKWSSYASFIKGYNF
jgi:hypothetical protein